MIVKIYNVSLCISCMISLMTVSLMSIKIYDHDSSFSKTSSDIVGHHCNIRVNTKSSSILGGGMMKSTRKIDSPS